MEVLVEVSLQNDLQLCELIHSNHHKAATLCFTHIQFTQIIFLFGACPALLGADLVKKLGERGNVAVV